MPANLLSSLKVVVRQLCQGESGVTVQYCAALPVVAFANWHFIRWRFYCRPIGRLSTLANCHLSTRDQAIGRQMHSHTLCTVGQAESSPDQLYASKVRLLTGLHLSPPLSPRVRLPLTDPWAGVNCPRALFEWHTGWTVARKCDFLHFLFHHFLFICQPVNAIEVSAICWVKI